MDVAWPEVENWLVRTLVGGGGVLAIGWLTSWRSRQPARQQRAAELAVLASLLVAVLALGPAWWSPMDWWPTFPPGQPAVLSTAHLQPTQLAGHSDQVAAVASAELRELALPTTGAELPGTAAELETGELESWDQAFPNANPPAVLPALPPIPQPWLPPGQALITAYAVLSAGMLVYLILGWWGLHRLRRTSRPAPAEVDKVLSQVLPSDLRRPEVRVHGRIRSPISFGIWQPTILLPQRFVTNVTPSALAAVLVHELMHLARRDAWSTLLFGLGQTLYFAIPWFWWLRRHARLAQELIADAAAARVLPAVDYAQLLVDWSARGRDRLGLVGAQANGVFHSSSDLSRRVAMLLRDERGELESFCPRWWTVAMATPFLLAVALATGVKVGAEPPMARTAVPEFEGVIPVADEDDSNKPQPPRRPVGRPGEDRLEDVIRRLTETLERLGDRADADARRALEETRNLLEEMRRQGPLWRPWAVPATPPDVPELPPGALFGMDPAWSRAERARQLAERRLHELRAHMEQLRRDLGEETEELKEARKKLLEAAEKRYKELAERAREEAERVRKEAERAREALRERFDRGPGGRMFPRPQVFGSTSRGRLGIQVEPVPPALASHLQLKDSRGLIVTEVVKDSPADKAGLKPHDILLEMDGKPVGADVEAFRKAVRELKGEARITLKVLREGKPVELRDIIVPPGRPDEPPAGDARPPSTVWFWSPEAEPFGRGQGVPPRVERREVSTVMTLDGKQFTLKHTNGQERVTITGEVVDGKLKPTSITFRDGKDTWQYSSLDVVPEPLRSKVSKLLNSNRITTNDDSNRDDD